VGAQFSFLDVINPVEPRHFFEQYWEKSPLYIARQNPDYYARLLTVKDVEYIIAATGLRHPSLRMVKNGQQIPLGSFTTSLGGREDVFSHLIEPDKVFAEYRQGATIILESLHRNWPALAQFCRNLEKYFNHPVQANIYFTPKASQGFAPHYDTHDVFVVQLAGSKHWRIYEAPVELPDRGMAFKKDHHETGQLLYEIDFSAGDLIYLPRGFMHEALTSEDISLHATIGILTYTWYDVLLEAVKAHKQDVRFRRALPVGFAQPGQQPDGLETQFNELLAAVKADLKLEEAYETLARRFISNRPPLLDGYLDDLDKIDTLELSSIVKQRDGLIYGFSRDENSVSLTFHRKKVSFPDYVEAALQFILEMGERQFTVAAIPGKLENAGKLVLVRRLVIEGFLTVVTDR
jgi:ribosomal protein L16 Arg81 hydroxylase